MKTTTMRTLCVIFSEGILLSSCVSSKKYHGSQAEVAKLRADSTRMAQDASTLKQNISAEEQKNADLQKNLEAANNTNAGLQKNVVYYHDYFDKHQAYAVQLNTDLKTTLAPSGITDQDVMQADGIIYVNIGEKSLFKGHSAVLTAKGKELVDNLGQFVKGHDDVDVSVADLQQTNIGVPVETASTSDAAANSTATMDQNTTANTNSSSGNGTANSSSKSKSNTVTDPQPHKMVVHHARRVQPVAGESKAMTYSSGHHKSYASNARMLRIMAWKRQNVVADALLKNGIPVVKLVSQNETGAVLNPQRAKGVQVVLVPGMNNFYKKMSEGPGSQPVGKNP
jgi:outer membrane murein-binding lipoprotein Lpp